MPQGSSSRDIKLSTFWTVASGRLEWTSAVTIGEVKLLVSLKFAGAGDVCDVGDVDRVWLRSYGWGD